MTARLLRRPLTRDSLQNGVPAWEFLESVSDDWDRRPGWGPGLEVDAEASLLEANVHRTVKLRHGGSLLPEPVNFETGLGE